MWSIRLLTAIYLGVKAMAQLTYGRYGISWDHTALMHNLLSVITGLHTIWFWSEQGNLTCNSFAHKTSLVIALQAIHSATDFMVYFRQMIAQPIFIAHHAILIVTCLTLPYCPGCFYTVIAVTIGEAGSATIAFDAEWRKLGLFSRGRKRLLMFGLSRILCGWFLYQIYLVTPSNTVYTVSSEGKDLFSLKLPVCMITSVGGAGMMYVVNGITWLRMLKAYRSHNKDNTKGRLWMFWTFDERRSAHPKTASLVDTVCYFTLMIGCLLLLLPQVFSIDARGETAKRIVETYCWMVFITLVLFLSERATMAVPQIKSKIKTKVNSGTKNKPIPTTKMN